MEREELLRRDMVENQIAGRGITDAKIVSAFLKVPRHLFVPESERSSAYGDYPLPIGNGQTISQPFVVAEMCRLAELQGNETVLEVGTGSGYAAAIFSFLAAEVYSIERLHSLHTKALEVMHKLGYRNVHLFHGDGYAGLPEYAPFKAIFLSAAPAELPRSLLLQLQMGGYLIAPVGKGVQNLVRVKKTPQGYRRSIHGAVRFVEMKHGFS